MKARKAFVEKVAADTNSLRVYGYSTGYFTEKAI